MPTYDSDKAMDLCGVAGRLTHRTTRPDRPERWFKQRWISEARPVKGYSKNSQIMAEVSFDDELNNGHASFAVTGVVARGGRFTDDSAWEGCGCLHDDIAAAFPELAHLIKWHLCSTDGPMHYIGNAAYHAGDLDHYGRRAGEVSSTETRLQFGDCPVLHKVKNTGFADWLKTLGEYDRQGLEAAFIPVAVAGDKAQSGYQFAPKWQFAGQPPLQWHECPFDLEEEAERFAAAWMDHNPRWVAIATAWSEGKERDLAAARSAAVWPEATDAELMVPRADLEAALTARLPALLAAFRADMDAAGLYWSPAEFPSHEQEQGA